MTTTAPAPDEFDVGLAVHVVATRTAGVRHERLVLRRTVGVGDGAGVEELWTSPRLLLLHAAQAVEALLDRYTAPLVLAEPVGDLPRLQPATAAELDELDAEVAGQAETTTLVVFRGLVRVAGGPGRVLRWAEVLGGPGLAGHRAQSLVCAVVARLGLAPTTGSDTDLPTAGEATGSTGPDSGADAGDVGDAGDPPEADDGVGSVVRASTAARGRLAAAARWSKLAAARTGASTFSEALRSTAGPQWMPLLRGGADPVRPDRGGPDCVLVTFVGASAGATGARRTELFQYRVSPRVDLRLALRSPAVREAFAECSGHAVRPGADPGRAAELRSRAVDSLRDALPGGRTGWRAGAEPVEQEATRIDVAVEALRGVVVLQDCRGVRVGNHVRRSTTSAYVVAPEPGTGELLREHPGLAESIVDHACAVGESEAVSVQEHLARAVCAAAEVGDARAPTAARVGRELHTLQRRVEARVEAARKAEAVREAEIARKAEIARAEAARVEAARVEAARVAAAHARAQVAHLQAAPHYM